MSDLAARLDLSRATVRVRMERLVSRGEIAGFSVLTRGDVTEAPVRGLMMIVPCDEGGYEIRGLGEVPLVLRRSAPKIALTICSPMFFLAGV